MNAVPLNHVAPVKNGLTQIVGALLIPDLLERHKGVEIRRRIVHQHNWLALLDRALRLTKAICGGAGLLRSNHALGSNVVARTLALEVA